MAGAPQALHEPGSAAGRMNEDDVVDAADVDAQFQTRACGNCPEPALLQASFDRPASCRRQRRMMNCNFVKSIGVALGKRPTDALGQGARVGEYQRCSAAY